MAGSRQKIENLVLFYETYFFDSESNTGFAAVLLTKRNSHNHHFPVFSRTSTEGTHCGGQCLTLGESVMQTASEVGCEVLKTVQMIFLTGLFHCYCVSPGLDTAAKK